MKDLMNGYSHVYSTMVSMIKVSLSHHEAIKQLCTLCETQARIQ